MMRVEGRSSKCRRDLINNEIQKLRDMLPLHEAVKSRLSYLHIMSLTCAYIRKGNFFNTGFKMLNAQTGLVPAVDFTQAVNGFLMVVKCDAKLIYVSENVTDYLGHSMIELLATGGDIYSVIDSRDHDVIYNYLSKSACQRNDLAGGEISFICRMNTARNMRRNDITLKNKTILMRGRYAPNPDENIKFTDRALMLTCLPIECWPSAGEEMAPYNTDTFYMLHSVDMKILETSPNVFFYTGYQDHELEGTSWYNLVHHEDLPLARALHLKMIQFGTSVKRSSILLRLLSTSGCQRYANVIIRECDTIRHTGKTGAIGCFITENHIIRDSEVEFYMNEVASKIVEMPVHDFPTEDISESATTMLTQQPTSFDNPVGLYDELDKLNHPMGPRGSSVPSRLDLICDGIPSIGSETPLNLMTEGGPHDSRCVTEQIATYTPFKALKSAAKLLVCDRMKRDVDKFRIPYSHAMEIISNLDQSDGVDQLISTNQDVEFLNDLTPLPLVSYASQENVSGYVQVTCQSQVTMGIRGQVQIPGNW